MTFLNLGVGWVEELTPAYKKGDRTLLERKRASMTNPTRWRSH
ncbi:MAG: hypothetical protein WBA57_05515 [Elainellaceae cyanobacterium]